MQVGGPVALLLVLRAANGAEIGGQRVEPDVKNVRLFSGNRNAPADGGASDAEIFEAAFDEAEDFVLSGLGLNEIGIFFVEIEQRLLERREFEEIVGFRDGFGGAD